MQQILSKFSSSSKELKSIYALTITAVLLGLKLTLDILNIRIVISPTLRIEFGFLAMSMIGMLFGPVMGMAAGFASDILGYFLNNGGYPFFPGYTLSAILAGMIWGLFLYQQPVKITRLFLAKLTINVVINIGFTSLWLYIQMGKGVLGAMPLRIFKNIALLPLEVILLFAVAKIVQKAYKRS